MLLIIELQHKFSMTVYLHEAMTSVTFWKWCFSRSINDIFINQKVLCPI